MATHSITTVRARAVLKPRHAPYWHRMAKGCYLGYRKKSATAPGAWVARFQADDGRQELRSLGGFDNETASERFDRAREAAEEWFRHKGRGGSSQARTVRQVCEAYVSHLRAEGRERAASDAEGRFKRWIYGDAKLASTPALKLTAKQVDDWRKALRQTLAIPQDKRQPATRPRSDATLNRDMTTFRAALNLGLENGDFTSDHPWRSKLKPIKGAGNRREVYLDPGQRRRLLELAAPDLAAFLRGLSIVPLRPGAVAQLNVGDFDRRLASLAVGKDKAGHSRRIPLPTAAVEFFILQIKDKLPGAPLFSRADGKRWDKDAWKGPVREAVEAAGLPENVTAYALRHSTITDLVKGGLPTLTVAQLSGTSVAMIEKHYGHLQQDQARAALAGLAL